MDSGREPWVVFIGSHLTCLACEAFIVYNWGLVLTNSFPSPFQTAILLLRIDDIVSGTKKMDAAMGGASKQQAQAASAPGPGGDEWELCPFDR